jgi:hypothetical protein
MRNSKIIVFVLTTLIMSMLAASFAVAEITPSKTASDLVVVDDEQGAITVLQTPPAVYNTVVYQILGHIQEGNTVASYFPGTVQSAIARLLPGVSVGKLVIYECLPLIVKSGNLGSTVRFSFSTVYKIGQPVVGVTGFVVSVDSKGSPITEWIASPAKVVPNPKDASKTQVQLNFTAETITKMKDSKTQAIVLAILSAN